MPAYQALDDLYQQYNEYVYGGKRQDYHIMRFYSAFVAVKDGVVVDVKGPFLESCPLVRRLYREVKTQADMGPVIKDLVTQKIAEFGFFTPDRKFDITEVVVPFGASEMMMFGLRRGMIDAAVIVCDGVGSLITEDAEAVQGVGARMNGLFFTRPIEETIRKCEAMKCRVVFPDARINQLMAVQEACEMGYKNIAVTVSGFMEEETLAHIERLEATYGVNIISLIVCTTRTRTPRIHEIARHADLVWGCASVETREIIGPRSILQISEQIPVFVLTPKGLNFISAYAEPSHFVEVLDPQRQYLLSRKTSERAIKMGDKFQYFLQETPLPVRSTHEPRYT
jgi:putative methanogenesis marker protein 8